MRENKSTAEAKDPTVKAFIEGLRLLEQNESSTQILEQFADNCTVGNVQLDTALEGIEGAKRYWQDYRHTFSDIRSTFDRITEAGQLAVLEWTSTGTLKTGRHISYRGISILTISDNRITDFMAYFDSRHLTAHLHL